MDDLLAKEPLWAACHQRIDQMWDAHNAVDDKLGPIIIFVSPPPGAPVVLPGLGAETSEGWEAGLR